MPICQAETMAVGGSENGCAWDACCSASAMATATAATRALISSVLTGRDSVLTNTVALCGDEMSLSAVMAVSRLIIPHNTMIAAKTRPMPRAVISSARTILFIRGYSHVCAAAQGHIYRVGLIATR